MSESCTGTHNRAALDFLVTMDMCPQAALHRPKCDKKREIPASLLQRVRLLVPLTATKARAEARPNAARAQGAACVNAVPAAPPRPWNDAGQKWDTFHLWGLNPQASRSEGGWGLNMLHGIQLGLGSESESILGEWGSIHELRLLVRW